MGLIVDPRPPDVGGRGMLEEFSQCRLVGGAGRAHNVGFWVAAEGIMDAASGIADRCAGVLSAGYGFYTF